VCAAGTGDALPSRIGGAASCRPPLPDVRAMINVDNLVKNYGPT
jgi:hypothetical protein